MKRVPEDAEFDLFTYSTFIQIFMHTGNTKYALDSWGKWKKGPKDITWPKLAEHVNYMLKTFSGKTEEETAKLQKEFILTVFKDFPKYKEIDPEAASVWDNIAK